MGVASLLGAFGTALSAVVAYLAYRNKKAIDANRLKRDAEQRELVARIDAAESTARVQLDSWQALSSALGREVEACNERETRLRAEMDRRETAMRIEVSNYRTEIVGLKNWLRDKGIEFPTLP